jgi:hypothetical protein
MADGSQFALPRPGSVAVVLGSAIGGFDELRAVPRYDAVFAVNDAAADYPGPLEAFVTLHPEHLPRWLAARQAAGYPAPKAVVATRCDLVRDSRGALVDHAAVERAVTEFADYRFPGMSGSGSSGLFAVKIALREFERVVLCGVPIDSRGHYFSHSLLFTECDAFRDAWGVALPYLKNRVRSLSGWTGELLGRPNSQWCGATPA